MQALKTDDRAGVGQRPTPAPFIFGWEKHMNCDSPTEELS
jgi:hypothetical protein